MDLPPVGTSGHPRAKTTAADARPAWALLEWRDTMAYRAATLERLEAEYDRFHRPVARRLGFVIHDPDAAEDLVHEAFIRLAAEIEAGRTPRYPGAWINRVAWNLAVSRARHQRVVDRDSCRLVPPNAPLDLDRLAIAGELTRVVTSALAELSPDERLAVLLAAQGYRGSEIAMSLGRTCGATRTLLCRARTKLRRQLLAWESDSSR